ncbi:MAG: hypothetical protein EOP04_00325 [Proteobacteria bacterium]|nr:MAG: hypothetical protein EOP04_00325 [Pseudomonadota bacterium]
MNGSRILANVFIFIGVTILYTFATFEAKSEQTTAKDSIILTSYQFSTPSKNIPDLWLELESSLVEADISQKRNFGYNNQTGYFLFDLRLSSRNTYLRVNNPLFSSLKAYDKSGEIRRQTMNGIEFFEVKPTGKILIVAATNAIFNVGVEALERKDLEQISDVHATAIIIYLISITLVLGGALFYARGGGDRVLLKYSAVIASFHGFAILSLFGFPFNWLQFEVGFLKSISIILSEAVACLASIWFISSITNRTQKSQVVKQIIMSTSYGIILLSIFIQSVWLTQAVFALSVLTIISGAILIHSSRETLGKLSPFFIAWSSIGAGVGLFCIQYVGLMDSFLYRYAVLPGALLDAWITLTVFARRKTKQYQKQLFLEHSLRGFVSNKEIEKFSKSRKTLILDSQWRNLTVMFIDFCKFSAVLEGEEKVSRLPDVEECIKIIMTEIAIHLERYVGYNNKTLGDGCLAYFGYSITGEHDPDHEQNAVNCAISIQRMMMRNIASGYFKYPFAVRIGINRGMVRIGNMASDRLDYTLLGHAVNMAKRFETGASEFEIIIPIDMGQRIKINNAQSVNKLVTIKNQNELVSVTGIMSFENGTSLQSEYNLAMNRYQKFHSYNRGQDRFEISTDKYLSISAPTVGDWKIIDFSKSGLQLLAPMNLCSKVQIRGRIGAFLINGEVVWSKVSEQKERFLLGIKITSFDEQESEAFFKFLSKSGNLSLVKRTESF